MRNVEVSTDCLLSLVSADALATTPFLAKQYKHNGG